MKRYIRTSIIEFFLSILLITCLVAIVYAVILIVVIQSLGIWSNFIAFIIFLSFFIGIFFILTIEKKELKE